MSENDPTKHESVSESGATGISSESSSSICQRMNENKYNEIKETHDYGQLEVIEYLPIEKDLESNNEQIDNCVKMDINYCPSIEGAKIGAKTLLELGIGVAASHFGGPLAGLAAGALSAGALNTYDLKRSRDSLKDVEDDLSYRYNKADSEDGGSLLDKIEFVSINKVDSTKDCERKENNDCVESSDKHRRYY
ncbi:MAG: hypothetical protein KGI02_03855 [Thaumarchaeota archaeon]|nr:hypothetical protein [Nitrososphaerota archaeon]MDE1877821.1 hypothetical protein [Nitrososphaerota archaeon]